MKLDSTRYDRGDVRCSECETWILKADLPKFTTRRNTDNQLIHTECGNTVRQHRRRRSIETMRRSWHNHRSPIKFSQSGLKRDILENKEKWENIIKNKT